MRKQEGMGKVWSKGSDVKTATEDSVDQKPKSLEKY